jgi:hypothetical protein
MYAREKQKAVRQVRTELAALPFEREKVRVPGALGVSWVPEPQRL